MGSCLSVFNRSGKALRVIKQVCRNDPNRKVVEIKPEHCLWKSDLERLFVGLKKNMFVEELILAGLELDDDDGIKLATALCTSRVERLNLNDNNFSGLAISRIIKAITLQGFVNILTIRHQRNWNCDPKVLMEIAGYLKRETTLKYLEMEIAVKDPDTIRLLFREKERRKPLASTVGEGSDLGMTQTWQPKYEIEKKLPDADS